MLAEFFSIFFKISCLGVLVTDATHLLMWQAKNQSDWRSEYRQRYCVEWEILRRNLDEAAAYLRLHRPTADSDLVEALEQMHLQIESIGYPHVLPANWQDCSLVFPASFTTIPFRENTAGHDGAWPNWVTLFASKGSPK